MKEKKIHVLYVFVLICFVLSVLVGRLHKFCDEPFYISIYVLPHSVYISFVRMYLFVYCCKLRKCTSRYVLYVWERVYVFVCVRVFSFLYKWFLCWWRAMILFTNLLLLAFDSVASGNKYSIAPQYFRTKCLVRSITFTFTYTVHWTLNTECDSTRALFFPIFPSSDMISMLKLRYVFQFDWNHWANRTHCVIHTTDIFLDAHTRTFAPAHYMVSSIYSTAKWLMVLLKRKIIYINIFDR